MIFFNFPKLISIVLMLLLWLYEISVKNSLFFLMMIEYAFYLFFLKLILNCWYTIVVHTIFPKRQKYIYYRFVYSTILYTFRVVIFCHTERTLIFSSKQVFRVKG
jgi:hypothetical protein